MSPTPNQPNPAIHHTLDLVDKILELHDRSVGTIINDGQEVVLAEHNELRFKLTDLIFPIINDLTSDADNKLNELRRTEINIRIGDYL